ncbi:ABC transporter ATP-binding protein [Peptostreptococcus stomatis]|uniref:ABC transporter ATP-binding protein n=1 Tax=Peptostreptococcus stomatis TaxID=341694 RepID=UPI0028D6203B|nr:ABC transporter ATP-binding protein [Peptostreptococcus stomatis]
MNETKWIKIVKWVKRELNISFLEIIMIFIFDICTKLPILITPWCIGKIIDGIVNKNLFQIKYHLIIMVIIYVVISCIVYIGNRIIIDLKYKKFSEISNKFMGLMMYKELLEIKNAEVSKLINILGGDILSITDFIFEFIELFINLILSIISIIIMLKINIYLSLISIVYFIIGAVRFIKIGKYYNNWEEEYKIAYDDYLDFNIDTLNGFMDIKVFNSEKKRLINFNKKNKYIIDVQKNKNIMDVNNSVLISIIGFIFSIISLILGSKFIFSNIMTVGALVAFYDYQSNFNNAITSFGGLNTYIQQSIISIERYKDALKGENSICELNEKNQLVNSVKEIKLDNVTIHNKKGEVLISNINYNFKPGKIYLVKALNGVGKSTFFNVISGLSKEYSGKIMYNNIDLKNISKNQIFETVGYIIQNHYIFSDTIKENILMGRDNLKDNKVAELLNVNDYICRLKDGLDEKISQHDGKLSGGELKKICLLRTFVDEYEVYILDEIFVGLDNQSIDVVYEIIKNISKNHIVICADHAMKFDAEDTIVINFTRKGII